MSLERKGDLASEHKWLISLDTDDCVSVRKSLCRRFDFGPRHHDTVTSPCEPTQGVGFLPLRGLRHTAPASSGGKAMNVEKSKFWGGPVSARSGACCTALFVSLLCCSCMSASQLLGSGIHLEKIKLPPGFRISLYGDKVDGARSMTLSPSGTVFVGTRNQGVVYAILPWESWRRAAKVVPVAKGLNSPNGVAFRDGALSGSIRP